MNRSECPPEAFIAPDGHNRDSVRELYERFSDLLLAEMTSATSRSPFPEDVTIPEPRTPDSSVDPTTLEARTAEAIEGSMNPAHPGYIGHMDSIPTIASILADSITAALNNNMLSVEMSPVFSRLETEVVEEFAERFRLGTDAGGVMLSGGSLANLQAVAVARNHVFGTDGRGLFEARGRPLLFASDVAHTSLQKAAMILGLGRDAVVPVETDEDSRLRVDALREKITQAVERGDHPFCVVATAGTTTTGNIDPLAEVYDIASKHDLWYHVDAAYGGALAFSAAHRDRLDGIERADSVTFNPQKWLYVAKTCAMVLFRDANVLRSDFRVDAPYMKGEERLVNRGEISIQGTRHADVLKLWLSLQHLGERGYEQLIDESYRLTNYLVSGIREREWVELASTPETNLVCFRASPDTLDEGEYDELNENLQQHLLREAEIFLSLPTYRGNRWLRSVLLNPYTDEEVLDRLFDGLDEFVARYR